MKKIIIIAVLIIAVALCALRCRPPQEGQMPQNNQAPACVLDVQFTATVDALIADENTGTDTPRYAVVSAYQSEPFVIDVGADLAANLEVGEAYAFKMQQAQVVLEAETYNVASVVSMYNLDVESIGEATEDQIGVDSIEIVYTKPKR